jgi:hypothetical protein
MSMLISLIIKFLVGFTFSLSIYSKVQDTTDIEDEVRLLRIIPPSLIKSSVYVLLTIELIIALSFLGDFFYFWRELSAISLLLFFIVTIMIKRIYFNSFECSCFGQANLLNKYPLSRNVLLITFCAINFRLDYMLSVQQGLVPIIIVILLFLIININGTIKTLKTQRGIYENLNTHVDSKRSSINDL